MITIWVPKRLVEVGLYNVAARSPQELAALSEQSYRDRVKYAAEKVRFSGTKIVMLTGPSASGKTTSAHKLAEELIRQGTYAHVVSLDNFFRGAEFYPRLPDGTLDYENPDTHGPAPRPAVPAGAERDGPDRPAHLRFCQRAALRRDRGRGPAGRCLHCGGHPCPEPGAHRPCACATMSTASTPACGRNTAIDGRRVINTQDIRLCRRTLRDAAARGRSPEKTLAMWDRVLDGETRYIKGFKTTADFLLDTSFTYELGLISRLLGIVRRQFTLEGHNAELWDETARRFEHVVPLELELLPADSMLREFYGSAEGKIALCVENVPFCPNAKKLFPNPHETVKVAVDSLQSAPECAIMIPSSAQAHEQGRIPVREVSFMDFNKIKEMGLEYAEKGKNAAMDLAESGRPRQRS